VSARHDWNSWDHYQAIHLRRINDYFDHFILSDRLRITQTETIVRGDGTLYCVDGLESRAGETGWPTLGDVLDEAHRWWVTWIEREGRTQCFLVTRTRL
jgi:hypothetical protein